MSLSQLVAHGISILEGNDPNNINITEVLTDYLQNQHYTPGLDMIDNAREIKIYVNMSGIKADDIDVDFFNNIVNIKGERHRPYIETDCVIHKKEIVYGSFERVINLPISVTNRDSVNITFDNGILVISIDKTRESRNRFSMRVNNQEDVENTDPVVNDISSSSTPPTPLNSSRQRSGRRNSRAPQSNEEYESIRGPISND